MISYWTTVGILVWYLRNVMFMPVPSFLLISFLLAVTQITQFGYSKISICVMCVSISTLINLCFDGRYWLDGL